MKLNQSKSLYVFYNPLIKISKIGVTQDVENRRQTIECASGMKIDLIYYSIPIHNYLQLEKHYTNTLNRIEESGEWFKIDPYIIKEHIESMIKDFKIDLIYRGWKLDHSISSMSKEFNVSRTAINKRISKFKSMGFDQCEKLQSKIEEIKINDEGEFVEDVPNGSKKIKPNIYENKGRYYAKKYVNSKWHISRFESLEDCELYLKGIKFRD